MANIKQLLEQQVCAARERRASVVAAIKGVPVVDVISAGAATRAENKKESVIAPTVRDLGGKECGVLMSNFDAAERGLCYADGSKCNAGTLKEAFDAVNFLTSSFVSSYQNNQNLAKAERILSLMLGLVQNRKDFLIKEQKNGCFFNFQK